MRFLREPRPSRPIQSFVRAIQAIMSQAYVNDSRGALPVSFELSYVRDNAPMQVYGVEKDWGDVCFPPMGEARPEGKRL